MLSKRGGRRVVSIPFERESLFKDSGPVSADTRAQGVSIPFERESLFIPIPEDWKSPFRRYDWERDILVFQFPSSGKVYSKKIMRMKIIDGTLYQFQFPSSGKVYSKLYTKIARDWIKAKRFNSLRAGKSIQSTRRRIEKDLMWWRVSIPFERESLFKVP